MVSAFATWPYTYLRFAAPFGFAARVYVPLVHDGFVPGLNESFGLELGADIAFTTTGNVGPFLVIPVETRWNWHLLSMLEGYLKLGVGVELFKENICGITSCFTRFGGAPAFVAALGTVMNLTPAIALRIEAGYPWLKIGLGFPL